MKRQTRPSIKSYEDELIEIQQAITDILTGAQEAEYNNQRVEKADLKALHQRERWLRLRVSRQRSGGIRVRNGIPLP